MAAVAGAGAALEQREGNTPHAGRPPQAAAAAAVSASDGHASHPSMPNQSFDVTFLTWRLRLVLADAQRRWAVAHLLPSSTPPPPSLARGAVWARSVGRDGLRPDGLSGSHPQRREVQEPPSDWAARIPPRDIHDAVVGVVAAVLDATGEGERGRAFGGASLTSVASDLVDGVVNYSALHLSALSQLLHHDSVGTWCSSGWLPYRHVCALFDVFSQALHHRTCAAAWKVVRRAVDEHLKCVCVDLRRLASACVCACAADPHTCFPGAPFNASVVHRP